MTYKRYIKRGDKFLGPYTYKSVKQKDGSVKSIYLGCEEKKQEKSITLPKNYLIFALAMVFIIAACFTIARPILTGFLISPSEYDINKEFSESGSFEWNVNHTQPFYLASIKLSGDVALEQDGYAKVYLENNGKEYIIFDSSKLNEMNNFMTGGAVKEIKDEKKEKEKKKNDKEKKKNDKKIPEGETVEIIEFPENNPEDVIENPQTPETNDKEIPANEPVEIINDETEDSFEETIIPENETPIDEIVIPEIDESLNETLDETLNETAVSSFAFSNVCVDTCSLQENELAETSYTIIVEIKNAKLNLEKLIYDLNEMEGAAVDSAVLEKISEDGEARVFITFKPEKEEFKTAGAEKAGKAEKVKKALSSVNYADWKESDNQIKTLSAGNKTEFKLKHVFDIIDGFSGEINAKGLEKLRASKYVARISLVGEKYIVLDTSVPLINATNTWLQQINGINITGKGEAVCVIDTGVDYNHTSLGGGWGNKVIGGYDFYNMDSDPMDDQGHGTHCAGIISSTHSTYKGVAPDAKIIAIKVCSAGGSCPDDDIIAGIEWCIANKSIYNISVISMSLGGGLYSSYCDSDNVANASNIAAANGIAVFAASGNDAISTRISSPACGSNVTSVGATTKSDVIADYTNRAAILDILVTGSSITSTYKGGGLATMSGTSMATPHAAGAAALLIQYQKLYNGLNLTPSEVESLFKKNGKTIHDSANGLNFSRINVLASINSILKINSTENSLEGSNAKIKFDSSTDLAGANDAFTVSDNLVSLDAAKYPQFNKSADLTVYGLGFAKTPVVLRNGIACSDCSVLSYSSGNFSFHVPHFTNYSAGANSNLVIWDESDEGMPFYNDGLREGNNASFFANYTNATDSSVISTASCNITFSDFSASMLFNATKNVFEYIGNLSKGYNIPYTISCNHTEFETLNSTDSIDILSAECGNPIPEYDWVINGSTSLTCIDEYIMLNKTSIVIQDNSSLTLQNVTLVLIVGANNITVNENARFTAENSQIKSEITGGQDFNLYIYGYSTINKTTLNSSQLNIGGNKTSTIKDSNLYDFVYLKENTTVNMLDSNFTSIVRFYANSTGTISSSLFKNSTYFYESSKGVIQDSDFESIVYVYQSSILNFTLPASNISGDIYISNAPTIYGFVYMPSSVTLSSTAVVSRYYPIYVNYTGTPARASGKLVNITNSSGALVTSGYTDADGLVNLNLTLNSSNYGAGNFTVHVNSSQDISLYTSTPINLQAADTSAPAWSDNKTYGYSSYTEAGNAHFNITWQDNVAVSSVLFESNYSGIARNYSMSNAGNNIWQYGEILPAGTFYWKSYANDSAGNVNSTDSFIFTIDKQDSVLVLELNGAEDDITVNQSQNVAINATLYNPSDGSVIIFKNGTQVASGIQSAYSLSSFAETGNYNITAVYAGAQNYSASSITYFVNVRDSTAPRYSNATALPSTPADYSSTQIYHFNITWQDNVNLSKVWIQNNFTGTAANYTVNSSSGIYSYNKTAINAGSYAYKWFANDTSGNLNSTSLISYIVDKADSHIHLFLDGDDTSVTIEKGDAVEINATLITPSSGTIRVNITKNNVQYDFESGSVNKKFSYTFSTVGTFKVTADYDESSNYNAGSKYLNVYVEDITVVPVTPVTPPAAGAGAGAVPLSAGCAETWVCSGWGVCADGRQTRTCTDTRNCGTTNNKPPIEQSCGLLQENATKTILGEQAAPGIIAGCKTVWEFLAATVLAFAIYFMAVNLWFKKKKWQWLVIAGESLVITATIITCAYLNCIHYVVYPAISVTLAVLIPAGLWLFYSHKIKELLDKLKKSKKPRKK